MKTALVLSVSALALATPAVAGNLAPPPPDEPILAPAPIPVATTPDWTGPYVGAQLGYGFGETDDGAATDDLDGIIGGLHAGYNYDLGNFVLGAEADYNLAELETDSGAATVEQVGRLKAKAGYDFGRALVYVTGGGAYGSADIGGDDFSDFGWVAGAGVDVAVSERITAGVEYLYHDFSDFDDTGIDASVNTVQAKVSYRF